jgi:hypothetical protein
MKNSRRLSTHQLPQSSARLKKKDLNRQGTHDRRQRNQEDPSKRLRSVISNEHSEVANYGAATPSEGKGRVAGSRWGQHFEKM